MGQPPAGYEPPPYLPPAADPYQSSAMPPYQPMPYQPVPDLPPYEPLNRPTVQPAPAWTNPTPAPYHQGTTAPEWAYQPPPRRSRGMPTWVLVTVAVVVAGALAASVFLYLSHRNGSPVACCPSPSSSPSGTGPGPSQPGPTSTGPSPTPTNPPASPTPDPGLAKQQATALDSLLTNTKASRGRLGDALNNIDQCQDLSGSAALADQVAAERQAELQQVQGLALGALTDSTGQPAGEKLRNLLVQALTVSIQADHGYANWARALVGNCAAPAAHDSNWQGADAASTQATQLKRDFLAVWNPIALTYQLPIRPDTDI